TVVKPPAPMGRLPLPDDAARSAAEKQVADQFKDDIARARSKSDHSALANKLIQKSRESKDDPAFRFVLLREAGRHALLGGDLELAGKTADEVASGYEVTAFALQRQAVTQLVQATTDAETSKALAEAALRVLDQSLQADDFDAARSLVGTAI